MLVLAFARYGIEPMVVAYTVFNVLFICVWQWFLHRLTGIRAAEILSDVLPFMLISAAIVAAVYWLTLPIGNMAVLFTLRVSLCVALYVIVMKLLKVKLLDECIGFFTSKFRKH